MAHLGIVENAKREEKNANWGGVFGEGSGCGGRNETSSEIAQ
jgi:hypothetical protein